MRFALSKRLRDLDSFGHAIKVNYRGKETYNSVLGGLLTLIAYSLTLVLIARSAQEMVVMKEPILTDYL